MRPDARRPRTTKWIASALCAALLLAAAGFILQRPYAFTRVWVPLLATVSGASIEASAGRLTWSGRVFAEGLRYRSDGLELEAARLALHVDPLSLLPGRSLVVHALEAQDAALAIRTAGPDAPGDDAAGGGFSLPRVGRAELEQASLRIVQPDAVLRVGPGRLTARDVGSSHGRLTLDAPLERRVPGREPLRGRVELALDLAAPATEADPVRVDALRAALFDAEGSALELSLAGRFAGPGDFALRGDVRSARPAALPALAGVRLGDALALDALDGTLALARSGAESLGIEADLVLRGLRSTRAGPRLPSALAIAARLRLEDGVLALEPVELFARDGEVQRGTLRAEGRVDVGAGARSDLSLTVQDVALVPWLRVAGAGVPEPLALPAAGALRWQADDGAHALDGELHARVSAPGVAETALVLRPDLRAGDGSFGGTVEIEGPGTAPPQPGRARLALSLDTAPAPPELDVDAALDSFDLTPFRPLWEGALDEPTAEEIGAEADADGGPGVALGAELRATGVRLDPLRIESGTLHVERRPGRLALRLEPARLAGGTAELDYARLSTADAERVELAVSAEGVRLPVLLGALGIAPHERYQGLLDLDGEIAGRAEPGGDPLARAGGQLRFEIGEAAGQATRLQRLIAKETGLEEFLGLRIGSARGDYRIEEGSVVIDELRLDGRAVHLVITGDVGVDRLELRVNPRIGPDLAEKLPTHLARWAAGTVLGQIALPLVVVVAGPYGDVQLSSRPAPPSLLADLYGGITGLVRWALPGAREREDAANVP